ncbi:endolytic transglycosylase MltG [Clostridium luticellarii]|uniref:Endolytic murein transglycosylase n=1 Tax=Clostridium luticellarii TaxID=1691940 RepID=A0A2T0BRG6_9CLOT|nr:endolytic transglycosylase MltG [Clostridium luticellarii]MCI1943820.1 endolytic transglycosylase MltG [Clostridium luticellarii]MCI1967081.1 endolytic transglycosylase MltG [Clostridium luticellarii]PRR86473.1 putative aminodeoxychorismate lyase [Clostridium luticellarii]
MKRDFKRSIFLLCSLALIVLICGILYYRMQNIRYPFKFNEKEVSFDVKQREKLEQVIDNLNSSKLIKNPSMLKWYIGRHFENSTLKPGRYSFSKDISLNDFVFYLKSGIKDNRPVKVIIPEGYDIEQVGSLLEKKGVISSSDFIKSCREYKLPDFVKKDPKRRYALEGYLFPDTYSLLKGSSGSHIIQVMLTRFSQVMDEIQKDTGKQIKSQNVDKIITMASIVEKEVEKPEERGKAASVFYNRLNRNMKLQSCATVLYALGVHKDKVYYKDLEVNSPYNTYKVDGLPEGPISNPGKECIIAAVNPDKTDYIYFVSKNDGTHFFTNSSEKFLDVKKITQGE